MSGEGLLWDAEQHRLLAAMGLPVYAHVDAAPWPAPVAAPPAPAFENLAPAQRPAPAAPAPAAAPRRVPRTMGSPEPAAVPAPARAGRGASLLPDRLLLALSRAACLNPADPDDQALMSRWPLDSLRHDPQAKRALWPQLRNLRKQRRTR